MNHVCCCSHNICSLHKPRGEVPEVGFSIGVHVPIMKTVVETLKRSKECGLGVCQIFMGNPMSYNIRSLQNEKDEILRYQLDNPSSHFIVHAPYLINLASDTAATKSRSRGCLHNMLRELENINCSVVLHTGAKGSLSDVAEQLNTMIDVKGAPPVLLENSDGAGTKLGKNYDELRRIAECVDRSFKLGFCIDTAHLYTSGECEFSREGQGEDVVEFLSGYRHRLIHLNDSQTCFGSHRDKHGSIGQGYIWKSDQRSLGNLVHGAMVENIPVILETPTALTDIIYVSDVLGREY